MITRADEDHLRRAMHDRFDSMDLPESLSSRLVGRTPAAEQRASEPPDPSRTEAIPRRKRRFAVVLAAATAVGAVALAAAVLTQRSAGPDSASPPTSSTVASPLGSTAGSPRSSLPSTGATRDLIRDTYPYVTCGALWGDPVGSADLKLDPAWPEALSTTRGGTVSAAVTNTGPDSLTGADEGLVVVLRDGLVAGAGYPDTTLVGRMSFVLAPGDSFRSIPRIPGMYLCDGPDRQPLPFGTGYEAVYVERFGSHIAFSAPVPIAVQH